ncbi:MAG: IS110 family RNA-guided transposase [Isosphaeraceae bacterium]
MVYVGMDIHRKRTQVSILDDDGTERLNAKVSSDRAALTAMLSELAPGTPIAFEAAYGWGWIADLLGELELEPHLVHPLRCRAIASARLKNDTVDARTLAHLLRTDLLPEAWLAPPAVRERRALLRHRCALVGLRTGAKNRIHAVLADQGITPPRRLWTSGGRAWLDRITLPPVRRQVITDCLELIDHLQIRIRALEREITRSARADPRVEALCQLRGIGIFTAMLLVAEIGDATRFPSARALSSWAGLTPVIRSSAEHTRHGHITRQGSPYLRWAMVEAAHVAKRSPPLASTFARIAARRGNKIATVAVARKLLGRCYHVLNELNKESGDDPTCRVSS